MILKTCLELFDRLRANAFDAQQLILGVADQISNGLDASFGELVSPTLRNTQIVIDVEACLFVGEVLRTIACRDGSEVARVIRARIHVAATVKRPILRLRQQLFDVAQRLRCGIGQTIGIVRGDRDTLVGDLDIFVALQTRTSRDRLTDDDVLLEALQRVDLTFDGCIGKDLCGLLEGSCRKE